MGWGVCGTAEVRALPGQSRARVKIKNNININIYVKGDGQEYPAHAGETNVKGDGQECPCHMGWS